MLNSINKPNTGGTFLSETALDSSIYARKSHKTKIKKERKKKQEK